MDGLLMEGGRSLAGKASARPAKNALLPCMAAALLTDEALSYSDSADLVDIASMLTLLRHLGVETQGRPGGPLFLNASALAKPEAPCDLVRRMHASIVVPGPSLARFGRARVSSPGGFAIGARPVDQHLKALEARGALPSRLRMLGSSGWIFFITP
jgi:UDP-N-acetylglucosamine 1-carboxyvinyltransferase